MKKKNAKDADHTTSLLRADTKRVSIARPDKVNFVLFSFKNSTHLSFQFISIFIIQTKYPPAAQNFMKKHPNSKMIEGMEALRQMASTSLFLQNEKNNSNSTVPTIQEHGILDPPLEMRKIEDDMEVFSLSDAEDDNDVLVKLGNETPSTSQMKSNQQNRNNIGGGGGVSFLMKPIQPERDYSSPSSSSSQQHQQQLQQQQQHPRSSKLSRTRAPVNQQKSKDPECTTEISLMTLDTIHTTKPNDTSSSTYASTTLSLAPSSIASSSYNTQLNNNSTDANPFRQATTGPSITSQSIPLKPIIQDGSTKLTIVQPMATTSVTSAYSSNITSSFEPELVLSPAKLGQ